MLFELSENEDKCMLNSSCEGHKSVTYWQSYKIYTNWVCWIRAVFNHTKMLSLELTLLNDPMG